jgi:rare lipoprotein A
LLVVSFILLGIVNAHALPNYQSLMTMGDFSGVHAPLVLHPALEQTVKASYYGVHDSSGKYTSSGQRFNPYELTAAHRSLPFNTRLKVTFNGKEIIVVVNDRGPAVYTGRSLDLSYGAAKALGLVKYGVAYVKITRI